MHTVAGPFFLQVCITPLMTRRSDDPSNDTNHNKPSFDFLPFSLSLFILLDCIEISIYFVNQIQPLLGLFAKSCLLSNFICLYDLT